MKLLLEESKKVITKIDINIATEIETKYPETAQEEREKIKIKYKNVERKLEVKRKKKWKSSDLEKVIKINHTIRRHYCLKIPRYQVKR